MTVFEKRGSGYIFTDDWNSHSVEATVSRLTITSNDGLKAEIAVLLDDSPVVRSQPTLTSVSGMDQFWRKLNRRRPFDDYGVDWEAWVENLAGRVLDAYREGATEIRMSDVWGEEEEDAIWLVDPYILAGKNNTIYGDPGTAKSMLGLFWAVLMDTGHVDSEHDIVTTKANCLFLDWESDRNDIQRRLQWLHTGMNIAQPSNVVYRYCHQPLINEVDQIEEIISRQWGDDLETPIVVVCDSLGMATGGRMVEESAVTEYFAALRSLTNGPRRVSTLTITHTNKEGNLYGNQLIYAESRNVWECKTKAVEKGQIEVGFFHRKANSVSKENPRAYQLTFATDGENADKTISVSVKAKAIMDTEVAPQGLSVSQLVLEVVTTEGPLKEDDLPGIIAEYKESSVDSIRAAVRTALSRYMKRDRIVRKDGMVMSPEHVDADTSAALGNDGHWKEIL